MKPLALVHGVGFLLVLRDFVGLVRTQILVLAGERGDVAGLEMLPVLVKLMGLIG